MKNQESVVTMLGVVGLDRDEKIKRAKYSFGPLLKNDFRLKREEYANTLPIICELFEYENIIPIYTDKANKIQRKILEAEGFDSSLLDKEVGRIEDEKDYKAIFAKINKIINEQDRIIIDLTHGFRHIPILATINLIMANIQDTSKIEHILFAKEIKHNEEYEIIDLREYLDMANISFALSNFTKNYTVANYIKCIDKDYQELINLLGEFSEHILANSILTLIEGKDSLLERIIKRIDKLEDKENIQALSGYITKIRLHLSKFRIITKNPKKYYQYYLLSKNLWKKGYYLNSITILSEAIGFYCFESFKGYKGEIKKKIEEFEKNNSKKESLTYDLTSQSKALVKHQEDYRSHFLVSKEGNRLTSGQKTSLQKKKKRIKEKIPQSILDEIRENGFEIELKKNQNNRDNSLRDLVLREIKIKDNIDEFVKYINSVDKLRNNLAHGNSSEPLSAIKDEIKKLLDSFEDFCLDRDILK